MDSTVGAVDHELRQVRLSRFGRVLALVPFGYAQRLGRPVAADLERVLLACLAKRPEDRPASAHVLREQLLACASAGKWGNARAAQWWARHKHALRSGGALARSGVAEPMTVTRLAD